MVQGRGTGAGPCTWQKKRKTKEKDEGRTYRTKDEATGEGQVRTKDEEKEERKVP